MSLVADLTVNLNIAGFTREKKVKSACEPSGPLDQS